MGKKSGKIECQEYDELVSGIEEAKARVREAGKKAAMALIRAFFAEYPHVKALGWTQYTPYHNDGDPCEFSVHGFYASVKDGVDYSEVSDLSGEDGTFLDSYDMRGSDKRAAAALDRIEMSVSPDVFEAAFGDHVMVIATPEGFHINEYDHS